MGLTRLKPQLHIGSMNREFVSVRNQGFVKPGGGFWTSTYTPEGEHKSDWIRWCSSEMPDWLNKHRGFVFEVDPQAQVLEVYSLESLIAVKKRFPSPGNLHRFDTLDFEKMAQEFDGMHLTSSGEQATRFSQPTLYGWDCESTLWFNMKHLTLVQEIPENQLVEEVAGP